MPLEKSTNVGRQAESDEAEPNEARCSPDEGRGPERDSRSEAETRQWRSYILPSPFIRATLREIFLPRHTLPTTFAAPTEGGDSFEVQAMALQREYSRDREGDNGIKIYLREIGQTKLLTPKEEIKLAARIKKGDKKARAQMIRANLRLVVKIAHDYSNFGLPLLDLISEGNIGLMKAVERFDPKKGAKLSTYAAWWIKQSIKRALANQSKTIRLPVHLVDKISKMKRASLALSERLGREPTDQELAMALNIPHTKVAQLRTISTRPASLNAPISDEDSTEFSEIVGDENAATPFEILREKVMRDELREIIKDLEPREAQILTMRFGLDGNKPKTLEEVGAKFKVTRERIRQIQNIALTKLRRIIEKRDRPGSSGKN